MPKNIYLSMFGLPYAHRMVIMNDEQDYWSEMDGCWTTDPTRAALYIDACDAGERIHELMQTEVPGKLYVFLAPLRIEIKTTNPISIADVQRWLAEHVYVGIEGVESENSMMAAINIDFNKLKDITE